MHLGTDSFWYLWIPSSLSVFWLNTYILQHPGISEKVCFLFWISHNLLSPRHPKQGCEQWCCHSSFHVFILAIAEKGYLGFTLPDNSRRKSRSSLSTKACSKENGKITSLKRTGKNHLVQPLHFTSGETCRKLLYFSGSESHSSFMIIWRQLRNGFIFQSKSCKMAKSLLSRVCWTYIYYKIYIYQCKPAARP